MTTPLEAGDVLCYSAGSTQTGPDGFRKVGAQGQALGAALARWPDLAQGLGPRPPLFINAYPAAVGRVPTAITVDTYLSPRVLSRALQLGHREKRAVILAGQPLFVADALRRHLDIHRPLPRTLLLAVGGYTLPATLEASVRQWLAPHVERLMIVQFYGVAEVDAGCLIGRERTADGQVIYFARPDIDVELDGPELLLSRRAADGSLVISRFATGDEASPFGDGWLVRSPRRLHPVVSRTFASWTPADWRRRTGYVARDGVDVWIQLRHGVEPAGANELAHFEFASRFGFSWLDKPHWK